jgi:copper(I)-binding protein
MEAGIMFLGLKKKIRDGCNFTIKLKIGFAGRRLL